MNCVRILFVMGLIEITILGFFHSEDRSFRKFISKESDKFNMQDNLDELLEEIVMMSTLFEESGFDDILEDGEEETDAETMKFYKLVLEVQEQV